MWRHIIINILNTIFPRKQPAKPTFGYKEADEIHKRIGPELYGEDGKRWPTMIGCGVVADEDTGEPIVFVSFLKGTEPKHGFPDSVQGIKTKIRLAKRGYLLVNSSTFCH